MSEHAFPTHFENDEHGLSKREYFAALAMHAIIITEKGECGSTQVATWAFVQADAMIAETEKQNET